MFSVGRSARRRRSRSEGPSWQGARINEILERHVPERQTHFYCRNATFQDIKPFFIAGTRRSKASKPFFIAGTRRSKTPNPFLSPERDVPRHQTPFYRWNATFQDIKPLFYCRNATFQDIKPFFIAGTPRSGILNHKMNCIFRGKTRAQLGSTLFFSTFGSAKSITISFIQNFIISSIIIYLLNFLI